MKTELIKRCVDGEAHGALPGCPEVGCKGRLRINDGKVVCAGAYSDEIGGFMRCYFKADPSAVQRALWRSASKSEAELAAESEFRPTIASHGAADLFEGLDMLSMSGKKIAAERLLSTARVNGINVPAVEQEAKIRFGSLIMTNPDKSANELLVMAEQTFGTQIETASKSEGSKAGTVCVANSGFDLISFASRIRIANTCYT